MAESWNVGSQNLEVHRTRCHTELQFWHSAVSPRTWACVLPAHTEHGEIWDPEPMLLVNYFYYSKHKEGAVVFISALGATPALGQICFLNCSCFETALLAVIKWLWCNSDTLLWVLCEMKQMESNFFYPRKASNMQMDLNSKWIVIYPYFLNNLWFDCCRKYKMGCSSLCHL